ncbi:MAG TPA: lipopolysaccharide core heptose(I) kinase RfaP [Candidatus Aphodousia faecavium]|nr:lipopolysaccharide core heptose(I) kinase RfaP [Candidatus Aphodousia faecavium]
MIILKSPFSEAWKDKDPIEEVEKISGNVLRSVKTRRTLRFDFQGKSYYLKLHHGTTYGEIFKNLLTGKLPVLGADREWRAIHELAKIGVDTMHGVAFGQKGLNPVKRTSFIITEDLSPTISLEDFCRDWQSHPPAFSIKKMLIERVAEMVKKMHSIGINHRDCYICHFLLHLPFDGKKENLKLSIIDLHRAQFRDQVPLRWRNKDLIGLYYSCLNIGLRKTDYCRFLKIYFQKPLKEIFRTERTLINEAQHKAEKIKERSLRKGL